MRMSSTQVFRQGVESLTEQNKKLSRLQEKLSQGKKVNVASDDPVAVVRILGLDEELRNVAQYQKNMDRAQAILQQEETLIASFMDGLDRVRELSVQANSGALTTANRTYLTSEMKQIVEQMMSTANSRGYNGEYLFSGSKNNTPSMSLTGGGIYQYDGDEGKRSLSIASNHNIVVSYNAKELFFKVPSSDPKIPHDAVFINVFQEIDTLIRGLEDPSITPSTVVENAIHHIDNTSLHLLQMRAEMGARLNSLDQGRMVLSDLALLYHSERSALSDLDYTETISDLSQQKMVLEAAQLSFMQVQGLNLFKYM
jgi:flagellin-like hook-associated protein FlgL